MKRTLCLLFIVGSWSIALAAEAPTPDDFAYALIVDTRGNSAFYTVTLPEKIYQVVTRSDLADIRVFNQAHEVVPHTIRRPAGKKTITLESSPLPFFPLFGNYLDKDAGLAMHVATDANGTIIDISNPGKEAKNEAVQAYLLDASALKLPAKELQLSWEQNSDSFVTRVSVESSEDLSIWRPLVATASLVKMRYGGHELGTFTIPLPGLKTKYLRLAWPAGQEGSRVTSVTANFQKQSIDEKLQWTSMASVLNAENQNSYDFDSASKLPVERLDVHLPQRNTLVQVSIKSRPDPSAQWLERYQGLIYELELDPATLKNEPIRIPVVNDRYWRLDVTSQEGGIGSGLPDLKLGWTPQELLFVARGDGPFRVAFGSGTVTQAGESVSAFIRDIEKNKNVIQVAEASPGEIIQLGGEAMLLPPTPPMPWKIWLLWGTLVSGVLLLGWMALSLNKKMNRSDTAPKDTF